MSRQETRNGWSGNSRARAPMSEGMFAEGGIAPKKRWVAEEEV